MFTYHSISKQKAQKSCWKLYVTASCLLCQLYCVLAATTAQALPIVPSLSGFGTHTPAGSGRHRSPPRSQIFRVTSRADRGDNTLRACVELKEPRVCVFEVAGSIALKTPLRIKTPYITIAGQTAPSPGITLTHSGIKIETSDVLIQHLAIRPGDSTTGAKPSDRDGVSIGVNPPRSARNIVLDHLSVTWGIDENLSTWYESTHDVTIANSIIAEGLHNSIHPKGPHSKGLMIGNGSQRITVTRNLLAANEERNPYIKPGSSAEVINNVVYGWGSNGGWSLCNVTNNEGNDQPIKLDFIGNRYIPGQWSYIGELLYAKRISPLSQIYSSDNLLVLTSKVSSARAAATQSTLSPYLTKKHWAQSERLMPTIQTKILTNEEAYHHVINHAGSRPFDRSPIDQRIIEDVVNRRGSIKDCLTGCVNQVGSPITYPRNARRLRLPRRPFADRNRDGYTNLENWLHRLAN